MSDLDPKEEILRAIQNLEASDRPSTVNALTYLLESYAIVRTAAAASFPELAQVAAAACAATKSQFDGHRRFCAEMKRLLVASTAFPAAPFAASEVEDKLKGAVERLGSIRRKPV